MSVPIVNLIKKTILSTGEGIRGCSESDIKEAMIQQNVDTLPTVYYELLLQMGEDGIYPLLDGDCTCKDVKSPSMKKALLNELALAHLVVPSSIFVFFGHQGYIYYWFDTKGDKHDPPVYGWQTDQSEVRKLADSISEFFYQELDKFTHISWKTEE